MVVEESKIEQSLIYRDRQRQKQLTAQYRDAAQRKYTGTNISIFPHSDIRLFPDGAFIEAVIWISKEQIKE